MTKALKMPVAIVLPHMRAGRHHCYVKSSTGPCPHPECAQGHPGDTYFVAEPAEPLPLNIAELESLLPLDAKRVEFRRKEWRHGKWPGLSVCSWIEQPEPPGSGPPLDVIMALPGQYLDGTWFTTDAEQRAFDAGVEAERARIVEGLREDAKSLSKPDMSSGMEMVVGTILDSADKIERGHFSDTSGAVAFGEALAKEFLEMAAEKKGK